MIKEAKRKIRGYLEQKINSLFQPSFNRIMMSNSSLNQQIQIWLKFYYNEQVLEKKKVFSFDDVGFNVLSATNEDGILLYLFSILEMKTRKCVDIGCGTIQGSNVANLILNHGFSGLLIDSNYENIKATEKFYKIHPSSTASPPKLVCDMIDVENVNKILVSNGFEGEIDFLTIDLDGIDYWIWKAINVIQPKIVLVEYQDALGPEKSLTVPYSPNFNFRDYPINKDDYNYLGASLNAFVRLGKEKGYKLVGCNKGGWNAFFVRSNLAEDILPEIAPASCFRYERNFYSMSKRYPLIKDMEWVEL